MPRFQWNQRSGCENHEQFRPALLQINTDAFGTENGRIKKCEQSRSAEIPILDHTLKFVQQINNRPAVQ